MLLNDPAAETRLLKAVDGMDSSFTPAGVALRIDHAAALQG